MKTSAAPATIHGDDPNDPSVIGDDHLSYLGTASANLFGEGGNDVLVGGAGANAFFGGGGDDELTGGSGKNTMDGGDGKDVLTAGPVGDWLDGGSGDDLLIAGSGNDTMLGGLDNDTFTWVSGNGSTTIDGGGGKNSLGMAGSDVDETYVVTETPSPDNRLKIQAPSNKTVLAKNIAMLGLDCLGGSDFVTVQPLTHTRVEQVGINLSDNLQPDNLPDTIIVNGTPNPDQMTVEAVQVGIQLIPSDDPRVPPTFVMGGVMKISGLPHYDVYAMNFVDDLTVNGNSGGDTIDVKSITGATHVNGNSANDAINVFAMQLANISRLSTWTPARVQTPCRSTRAGASPKTHSWSPSRPFRAGSLPGVKYKASGGNYGGGINVVTTNWDDDVNIVSTLAGVTTTVNAMGGNDTVRVSPSARQNSATSWASAVRSRLTWCRLERFTNQRPGRGSWQPKRRRNKYAHHRLRRPGGCYDGQLQGNGRRSHADVGRLEYAERDLQARQSGRYRTCERQRRQRQAQRPSAK